jgi:hypothetical protein
MIKSNVQPCAWCDKEFDQVEMPDCYYTLVGAGTSICLDCSDKWEDQEIRLHIDKLHGFITDDHCLKTANGHELPLRVVGWSERTSWLTFKLSLVAEAIDAFGRMWECERTDQGSMCTIKPKRRSYAWV